MQVDFTFALNGNSFGEMFGTGQDTNNDIFQEVYHAPEYRLVRIVCYVRTSHDRLTAYRVDFPHRAADNATCATVKAKRQTTG